VTGMVKALQRLYVTISPLAPDKDFIVILKMMILGLMPWCSKCNEIMLEAGGWDEESEEFAQITIVCADCYDQAKERNRIKLSDEEFESLIQDAYEYLNNQIRECKTEFKILNYERFDYDNETGEIIFSDHGIPKVIAEYQNVGSFSTKTNTWLWAWANDSITEDTRELAQIVRGFGETHGIEKLTTAHWEAEEVDGWEMTALTAKLTEAMGAYRAPVDHLFIFMIFTDVRWADKG
jgi:hypothetical protein